MLISNQLMLFYFSFLFPFFVLMSIALSRWTVLFKWNQQTATTEEVSQTQMKMSTVHKLAADIPYTDADASDDKAEFACPVSSTKQMKRNPNGSCIPKTAALTSIKWIQYALYMHMYIYRRWLYMYVWNKMLYPAICSSDRKAQRRHRSAILSGRVTYYRVATFRQFKTFYVLDYWVLGEERWLSEPLAPTDALSPIIMYLLYFDILLSKWLNIDEKRLKEWKKGEGRGWGGK